MLNKIVISAIACFPLFSVGSVLAAVDSHPGSRTVQAAALPASAETVPAQPHKCPLLAMAIAQNPTVEDDKIVGTVYSVIGNMVLLELENGETRHVNLDWWERGHLGQLLGKKVVVRDVYCSRVDLAPPPAPVVKPIEIPAIQFSPVTPVVPPLTPRPTAEPAPAAAPEVIPQTW
ncbi:hypothetical protein K9N68_17185 [Kovacikia minuta CCNUW1]|uniref:hypothetical protein n=1 Tax=Kovacikia minuta TaxID=2931930 RepID=UPI001CCC75A9|nr:hypothetical protein [Kovacikia minuta]UBF29408.1 hypothetical protein K9N68_17185 [Kovacikia minuta CCNUW1]